MRRSALAEISSADRRTPRCLDDLRVVLQKCNGDVAAVRVEGGNTLSGMGSSGRADIVLSTAALDRLIAHEVHDLTCATESGMRLSALRSALAQARQFVPLDAPLPNKATVGGTVAAGWLGPRRHLFGRPRDLLIGSEAVLADGTLVHSGGMVVKNVTGYDMSRMYAGSFGTLAVLTRLNFKTLTMPPRRRVLLARLPEATREGAVVQLSSLPFSASAVAFVEGFRKDIDGMDGVDGRTIILLEGSDALVDRQTRDLRTALGRAGVPETVIADAGAMEIFGRLVDAPVAALGRRSLTYRSLGDPSSACERAVHVRDAANARQLFTDVLLDPINGDVFVRVSDRDSRTFARKIEECHNHIRRIDPHSAIVAGDAAVRETLGAWGASPSSAAYMQRMKDRFDPNNILNPGRFIVG